MTQVADDHDLGRDQVLNSGEQNGYAVDTAIIPRLLPISETMDATPNSTPSKKRKKLLSSPMKKIRLLTRKTLLESNKTDAKSQLSEIESPFKEFQNYMLRHLYQTLPSPEVTVYPYLRDTQQEIDRILKQSIIQKESHSAILVGPRNSYKTFLLNHELNLLSKKYNRQFITIRLNGFVHSETTAINSIATQLEEELTRLHHNNSTSSAEESISSGSNTEVFEKVLRLLDSTSVISKEGNDSRTTGGKNITKITVIFIFDEIDTFAGPVRQTLLYNLFDMVEHARVPVCIFGCTTKLNILEYLEKRVRSRFSQRVIYMPQVQGLDNFIENVSSMLTLPAKKNKESNWLTEWNTCVEKLLSNENCPLYKALKTNYETFNSLTYFKNGFVTLVREANNFESLLEKLNDATPITSYNSQLLNNSLTSIIRSLSDLELAILISSARVIMKTKDETTNFNLSYAEYQQIVKGMNARIPTIVPSSEQTSPFRQPASTSAPPVKNFDQTIKQWKKSDVKNIWESLLNLNLLIEKSALGLKETSLQAYFANNNHLQTAIIPFDLRPYQLSVTLQELRRVVPRSSIYYSWTQL